jgi:hypothetical protein
LEARSFKNRWGNDVRMATEQRDIGDFWHTNLSIEISDYNTLQINK